MNPIFIINGAKSASEKSVDKMKKNNNKKNALIKTEPTSARLILKFEVIWSKKKHVEVYPQKSLASFDYNALSFYTHLQLIGVEENDTYWIFWQVKSNKGKKFKAIPFTKVWA